MSRQQQWNTDTKLEYMAAEFLDNNFYPIFKDKATVVRHHDTYHQFGGIDITLNTTNFDEKCKCYGCLNKVQQFPSLECSIVNKAGYVQDGWFVASNISTDYYAFIGLSASVNNVNELTSASQISAADVLWVKKEDIKDFLLSSISIEQIKEDCAEERQIGDKIEAGLYESLPEILGYGKTKDGKYRRTYGNKKFWLTYSSRLQEQPVNLVMERKIYESLPHTKHFIVYKGKVVKA